MSCVCGHDRTSHLDSLAAGPCARCICQYYVAKIPSAGPAASANQLESSSDYDQPVPAEAHPSAGEP